MLSTQFLGYNVHFAANLLAALVCFAVFWLVFDAWLARRTLSGGFVWTGFIVLAGGFVAAAATVSSSEVVSEVLGWVGGSLKLAGLLTISLGQMLEPYQQKPKITDETLLHELIGDQATPPPTPDPGGLPQTGEVRKTTKPRKRKAAAPALFGLPMLSPSLSLLSGLVTFGAFLVAVLYWRRATTGLERHLRPVAFAFVCIALAELATTITNSVSTNNPLYEQFIAEFGPLWWAGHVMLILGSVILGRWVWNYLTKRLLSQLFMTLITQAIVIFLVSTVSFSYLMLRDIQTARLSDLATASHVLQYAVASRQSETVAQAGAVAAGNSLEQALTARSRAMLSSAFATYFTEHQLSTLTVTDAAGIVLWRAQDPERYGDSRSGDPLVRRALVGEEVSNVLITPGVTAPSVTLAAASPVRASDGTIIGTVTLGRAIDNAFVDHIKSTTGLEVSVYGGNTGAATTLKIGETARREVGVRAPESAFTTQVLDQGKTYSGSVVMQNRVYLTAATPLLDINNEAVGILQAMRPASDLSTAAGRSLQYTFLAAVILIFVAAYPLYRLARFLEHQIA